MQEQRKRSVALIALVFAMALWGSSFIALKLAFSQMPPMWVIFGRMAFGLLVFLLAWRWRGDMAYRAGDWKYLIGMSACEPCLYFIFEAMALERTSASQAGMITALLPLMVAVGAWLAFGERTSRTTLMGFGVAIAGAVWLSLASDSDVHAPNPLVGNFCELLAMVCATGYTLLLKHLSSRYSVFFLTAMQALIGAPFFLLLAWSRTPPPTEISLLGWLSVAYLGVVVTVGAYGLYNFGVSRLPASQASGFTNLLPVFTLLFATLLLGERMNLMQMLAAGLVFVGVALSQWRTTPPTPSGILD